VDLYDDEDDDDDDDDDVDGCEDDEEDSDMDDCYGDQSAAAAAAGHAHSGFGPAAGARRCSHKLQRCSWHSANAAGSTLIL